MRTSPSPNGRRCFFTGLKLMVLPGSSQPRQSVSIGSCSSDMSTGTEAALQDESRACVCLSATRGFWIKPWFVIMPNLPHGDKYGAFTTPGNNYRLPHGPGDVRILADLRARRVHVADHRERRACPLAVRTIRTVAHANERATKLLCGLAVVVAVADVHDLLGQQVPAARR
eukprot:scaffold68717_cov69-Phaeocystis_antarctica.AAC.4